MLDNWPSLLEKLQSERDLARENAEYLSTLQEYFVVSIIDNHFSFIDLLLYVFCCLIIAYEGVSSVVKILKLSCEWKIRNSFASTYFY